MAMTMEMNSVVRASIKMLDFEEIILQLKGYAVSEIVKEKMDQLDIYTDYYLIKRHQGETSEARTIIDSANSVPLHSLVGIQNLLCKLPRHEILRPSELEQISNFIKDTGKLKWFMMDRVSLAPKVSGYAMSIEPLESLHEEVGRCIVSGRVDDNASASLAKLRKKIDAVEDKIKSKLQDYLMGSQYGGMLTDAIISQRDGRYVIPVKSEHKRSIDGMVLDRSRSGGTVFVEPAAVRKLSDELSQLKIDADNETYRILSELTNRVAMDYDALHLNYEVMITYDFLFAKAKLSRKFDAQSAEVNRDSQLKIVAGRHPLLGVDAVPMSLNLSAQNRNLVITGPNTGGKTVTMKTVGLFCLMTQAGLHVPCEKGTTLPIFEKVLCDIGDGQNVQQNLSTFSAHIGNIIRIIEAANSKSLIILDEIGAGTDPSEGTGIGIAVLETLNKKKAFILISTHYNEIKVFAKEHPDFVNGCMAFDLKSLKPLYRLEIGKAGESNALHIALRIGMSETLISRAHEIAYKEKKAFESFSEHDEQLTIQSAKTLENQKALNEATDSVSNTFERPSVFEPKKLSEFKVGDSVYVTTMKRNGIVCESENGRCEIGVRVLGKKIMVNHKRLSPYIDSKDLYPDDYDLDIVFETKNDRKKDKLIGKGKGKGVIIEKKGNV